MSFFVKKAQKVRQKQPMNAGLLDIPYEEQNT